MKKALLGCGCLIVVCIGLFIFWWSRNPIVFSTDSLEGTCSAQQVASRSGRSVDIEVKKGGSGTGYFLSSIDLPRELVVTAGIGAPAGFREEPIPLDDSEKDDPASVAFVEKFNRENVRFAGRLPLAPGQAALVSLPATAPHLASGQAKLTCEWRGRILGGSMSFATVDLAPVSSSLQQP